MLPTRRLSRSAAILAGLITLVAITLVDIVVVALPAAADTTDGTLTIIVNRDLDRDGNYSSDIDQPQPGIEIAITDASGSNVKGLTGRDGRFVLRPTSNLKGGRYFVVARAT